MKAYSMDLREKKVESVKKGLPKSETAQRFGVHRATVKRHCNHLDEHATLEPGKTPGKKPKLEEKQGTPFGKLPTKAAQRIAGSLPGIEHKFLLDDSIYG